MSGGNEFCYECTGYGDNYFINEEGELECRCDDCWWNDYDDEEEC